MNDDLRELLESLMSHKVEFLVIGAHAVSFYVRPRMTEDIDLWVGRDIENANRLAEALAEFGAPIGKAGAETFANLDRQMIRLGVPPNMADILNFAGSTSFADCWSRRVEGSMGDLVVHFPSKLDLIEMKRSAGRPQDLVDADKLERA